jgi:hypothetical protein
MKYRKLRIAFSAVCGVLCLLLIALWVRSYWRFDQCKCIPKNLTVGSRRGEILLNQPNIEIMGVGPILPASFKALGQEIIYDSYSPNANRDPRGTAVPFWAPTLIFAIVASLPWLPWRFSLRTLLIATTLVAILLGLIVYAAA